MTLQPEKTDGDTGWFTHDRFGMFIHWGLYALPARHEWVKSYEKISTEDYEQYFRHFDPDLYNPDLWAQAASNAGMKYFVVTTKHHEGFCLWDSDLTAYKAPNTPARATCCAPSWMRSAVIICASASTTLCSTGIIPTIPPTSTTRCATMTPTSQTMRTAI